MIRRPPRSTLFPTRRSSDLLGAIQIQGERQYLIAQHRRFVAAAAHDDLARLLDLEHARPGHAQRQRPVDRKSTRLNSSHTVISYAVFCLKKKKQAHEISRLS